MANTRGKAQKADDAADSGSEQTQKPETVMLRYLGPSHEFLDTPSGLTFIKDGRAHQVDVDTATRLQRQPHESFDRE